MELHVQVCVTLPLAHARGVTLTFELSGTSWCHTMNRTVSGADRLVKSYKTVQQLYRAVLVVKESRLFSYNMDQVQALY